MPIVDFRFQISDLKLKTEPTSETKVFNLPSTI